ncbi:MAG: EAL domain-containing protein [Proteobacteria bacterium]|nr:EAL domain-containing protein [Pseudomonadota bacterium]
MLNALSRLLRQDCYRTITVESATNALAILRDNEIGVIVSNHLIPGMTGVEFFAQAKEICPDTVRILMTDANDVQATIEAVNDGAVSRLLEKPWQEEDLRSVVHEAYEHYELVRENKRRLQDLACTNEELKSLNVKLERRVEQKTRELSRLTNYDAVTGLPNRLLFSERLTQALGQARRNEDLVGVMFLNLDRFNFVNNTLGYAMGDRLLQAATQRLVACVREGDTVARIGADEFAFLLTNLDSEEGLEAIATRILNSLSGPFRLDDQEVFATASIGISLYPSDDDTVDGLLKNAATAVNRAKQDGNNHYRYYAREMNVKSLERLTMESRLHQALERDEFLLYYHPKVDLRSGRLVGVEALLRWQHPELGIVSPGEFIPVLEETGLINQAGDWVLRRACAQVRAWREMGLPLVCVAVNLSIHQFKQKNLVDTIRSALREAQLGHLSNVLELDITENLLMEDASAAAAKLRELEALGVRVAIDDFGTGYSSLSHLKRFPIHTIKIDRSFVKHITNDPDDEAIVTAIIGMARGLKLQVVAEGVETREQMEFLRAQRCDEMQGYLVTPPLPDQDIIPFLEEEWVLEEGVQTRGMKIA